MSNAYPFAREPHTQSDCRVHTPVPEERITDNNRGQGSYRSSPLTAAVLNFDTSEGEEA